MVLSKLLSSRLLAANKVRSALLQRMMATAKAPAGHEAGHQHNPDLWKKIFIFVCIPAILISAANTYLTEKEHQAHFHQPEFKPYEYMYIRKKPFPWGDGTRSLFHNPKVNALPTGYEEIPENKH